ncbi:MAG: hypothetical protein QHH26_13315 [Armatimonadota bacterium]|nr:hypothetical protein [Armatimonadota bacterium]
MNIATELTPEERDKLIDELATKIVNKRMETPAIIFLEMHKPVAFIASQAAIVASPFLVPLFGREGVEKYSQLFSSPENVERIIQRIEDLVEEREHKADKSKRTEETKQE